MDDVHNPGLDTDDENAAWSKNEVAEILQVGDIVVIKADDLVYFFYLLRVATTVHTLNKKVFDNCRHVYHPTQEVIAANYLQIPSGDMVSTKYFLESRVALTSSSMTKLCPNLHETNICGKRKIIQGYEMENSLREGLKEFHGTF